MKQFHKIIEEICKEEEIKFRLLSKEWISLLEKNQKVGYIAGYKFDLNGHGIGNVLDDKYAFYEVLLEKGYPTIKHHIIFRNYQTDEIEKLFHLYHDNVVIKSNTGTCGGEVFHVEDRKKLFEMIDSLLKKHFSISLCPFYSIKSEYRVIVLEGEVKLLYQKKKAVVIGDGKSNIQELLCQFNSFFFKKKDFDSSFDRVLEKGEIFIYSWKFNLSQGAIPVVVEDESLKTKLSTLALEVSNNLGIVFGSIDIIQTEEEELLIMEANSGVMMDHLIELYPNGYQIAKEIYREAILKMFSEL
ncbi:MAG: hypothetical protein K2L48_05125 [Mycoplasmoidaceae bacterium]|nr:hypothetical protein [Mycoplasmoidaceae bacterium]